MQKTFLANTLATDQDRWRVIICDSICDRMASVINIYDIWLIFMEGITT